MKEEPANRTTWALKLFHASPLKRRKLRKILAMIDSPEGKRSLDIGSDNGVISMLLRQKGGEWASADLIPETVESIRGLVQTEVYQIDGRSMPFADRWFDQVIIVDFLEHIETDVACARELARILKPGGTLVVNVPNPGEGLIRRLRFALGQTDAAHGHLRPGYSLSALQQLLAPEFEIERSEPYSRFFSEFVDTVITGALDLLKGAHRGQKGNVVRGEDLKKLSKSFKLFRIISPFLSFFVWLDELFPFLHGNLLIIRARRRQEEA